MREAALNAHTIFTIYLVRPSRPSRGPAVLPMMQKKKLERSRNQQRRLSKEKETEKNNFRRGQKRFCT